MTMTVQKAQLNNQSILQNFGLVEELGEQAGEIISGGVATFTVENTTSHFIWHRLDNSTYLMMPGQTRVYTSNPGPGMIEFDTDPRLFGIKLKSKNLANAGTYKFQPNAGDPNMIDLVG